ncbi:hypothetical protein SUGI_0647210 [Cryptomeria japonica]|nr:hypothetical protein SUGI_0647210 [Cryptomeria japonica]
MVHQTADNKTVVIGILYKYGKPDIFLAELRNEIQSLSHNTTTEAEESLGMIGPKHIKFGSRKYYTYIGSFTTLPCIEGVTWIIMHKVRSVSREQVRNLIAIVHDQHHHNVVGAEYHGGCSTTATMWWVLCTKFCALCCHGASENVLGKARVLSLEGVLDEDEDVDGDGDEAYPFVVVVVVAMSEGSPYALDEIVLMEVTIPAKRRSLDIIKKVVGFEEDGVLVPPIGDKIDINLSWVHEFKHLTSRRGEDDPFSKSESNSERENGEEEDDPASGGDSVL